jgi:tetratricopeptide (TPR) repeat protein
MNFALRIPLWLLSGVYVVARVTVFNFQNTLNFYDQSNLLTEHFHLRLYTYLTTLPKGLLLWLWPTDLHHERSWSVYTSFFGTPHAWLSLLLVAVLLGLAAWLWSRARRAAVGIVWFFVATLPTSNLLVLINALFYDHWFLLPGLGLAIAAGQALANGLSGPASLRRITTALSLAAVVAFSAMTRHYNAIWRTPLTLYSYILSWEPTSAKIHNNLAMAYADEENFTEAIRLYKKAIELNDEFPQTHHNLANAYLAAGDEERALQEFQRAVEMDPQFFHSWARIGAIYFKRDQLDACTVAFEQALRAYPYAVEACLGLAQVHIARGRDSSARAVLQACLRAQPRHPALQAAIERLQMTNP